MLPLCCAYPIVNGLRAKSLEGNWRPEMLFVLKQEVEMYDIYQQRIAECDRELEAHLKSFADNVPSKLGEEEPPAEQPPGKKVRTSEKLKLTQRGKKAPGNRPQFDLRSELYRISGVDLTRIDSINVLVAQTVISEVGLDMSRWNTEAQCTSWCSVRTAGACSPPASQVLQTRQRSGTLPRGSRSPPHYHTKDWRSKRRSARTTH